MLEFGKLTGYNTGFPPALYRKTVIPSAQVLTAFTTPVTLVIGQPGYIILPERFFLFKPAGTAYTIAGVTNCTISWTGSATSCFQAVPTNFMDQSIASCVLGHSTQFASYIPITHIMIGTNLEFKFSGANPAAGNSDLNIFVEFRAYTVSNLPWS